jgi:hypothetical protein
LIRRKLLCVVFATMQIGKMIASTIAVLVDPARIAEVDAVLMMIYGSLSALVGAYFCFSGVADKQ